MINTSQQYKEAVYSPSRATDGKIIFQVVDLDAADDATVTADTESIISRTYQIVNTNVIQSAKYASFEQNLWKLDGSFIIPPRTSEPGYEVGWVSDRISDDEALFPNEPILDIQFTKDHSSIGLTIYFDLLNNGYAEIFEVMAFDKDNNIISDIVVDNNTSAKYMFEQPMANYRRLMIIISKWNLPYRRAKISEIGFGIIYDYTGSEIVSMSVLEEIDPLSSEVSSNEFKFTLDNADKKFNILNPQGVYPALQRKQKLTPYIGIEKIEGLGNFEYIPMGIYYLTEWKSDEGTLTASFTARDILDILSQSKFINTTFTNENLYNIAANILTAAGVKSSNYSIDSTLQSVVVTGSIEGKTYREALQIVAIAARAVIYSDRNGLIIIKQLSNIESTELIDFDNIYNPPEIKLDALINTVYINDFVYVDPSKPSEEQTLSVKIENPLINDNTLALSVAQWVLTELKKRFVYDIPWRMNPSLEAGDIVTVEDQFGENNSIRILKQEFNFAGFLGGKTSGKGGGS